NLPLMISDSNPVMNTELVDTIRTQNLLAVSAAAVSAAISREETRGNHIRTDFPETSDSPSHSLSHEDGTTSNLSMRS
ncbi:MAG: succinate dehydrogenase/fumarate reductase flavoprotein subunit, partial [Candidatus Thermoplasmatota archaeon]|nr:succinate dehydrogenase/fumarate reductase flavoprotein subunit [Candidatus Thermoplasmatota archaeon]